MVTEYENKRLALNTGRGKIGYCIKLPAPALPGQTIDYADGYCHLIVTRDNLDYGDLIRQTSALVSDLSLRYDVVISRAFVTKERFQLEQSPFLMNVRREGIAV